MFYSSELLSRSGKTPLARLWQMAHDVRVNKKVIEEFDIAEGVEAIEKPQQKHALRLTATLLVGITKIFSQQVNTCANAIKTVHERITLTNFACAPSSNVDLKPSSRKGDGRDSITLNANDLFDDSLMLDIPDELPPYLAGGEKTRMTTMSQLPDEGESQQSESALSSRRGGRKSANINLPDHGLPPSAAESISDAMDDMSDLLHPGFEESEVSGPNPLDIPLDDFEGSIVDGFEQQKASKRSSAAGSQPVGGSSSGGAGGGGVSEHESLVEHADNVFHHDMDPFEQDDGHGQVDDIAGKDLTTTAKKKRKRKEKKLKIDQETCIPPEEYKKWLQDAEAKKLTREPNPKPKRKVPSLEMALSLPSTGYMGKRLTELFLRVGYMANKPIKEKIARKKADKEFMTTGKDKQDDAADNDARQEQVEYEPGILDDIDFGPLDGDSSGNGGSFSFSDEQPEKIRDGNSADGSIRASSKRSSRMSADSFEIPNSYNLDFDGSAAKSGSSRRSRLSILGALGDDPLNMDSQLSDISLSLREEPESHPSLDRHLSQLPTSQRMDPYQRALVEKVAAYFAKNVAEDAKLSFFEVCNPNFKTKLQASKMFMALLIFNNEDITRLSQEACYGDIHITATAKTLNYNL